MAIQLSPEVTIPEYMFLLDIKEVREICQGSYGTVKEVSWNGSPCAAKSTHSILRESEQRQDDEENYILRQFKREAYTWAVQLRHPNIVQFLGLWEKEGVPSIVMELLYQDLSDFVEQHKALKDVIRLEFTRSLAIDVCRAFTYLESIGVIHRDLKGNNVLLTSHFVAKVSDFGAARLYDNFDRGQFTKKPGNQYYSAPEAFGSDYGPEVDVFSYGCLLIEMVTYSFPMPRESETLSEYKKREHLLDSLSPAVHEEFQPLIRRCLNDEPADRPKFAWLLDKLLSKPFVTDDERYEIINAELPVDSMTGNEPSFAIRDGTSTEISEQVPSQDDSGRSSSIIPQSTDGKFREGLAIAIVVAIMAIILNLIQYFY